MNDWSARDTQRKEMRVGLGPAKAKDFATSFGPVLVTADEFGTARGRWWGPRSTARSGPAAELADLYYQWPALLAQAARNAAAAARRHHRLRHRRHRLHPGAQRRPLAAAR